MGPKSTKETIFNNLVTLLHQYRQKCAAQSSPSQLILPDNLKLLPMYTLTALKTPAFKLLYNCKLDAKIYWVYKIMRMPISMTPYFFYPRIYRVTMVGEVDAGWGDYAEGASFMSKPNCYPATLSKLGSKDAYVIDNGEYIFLYIGNQVPDNFIYNVSSILA
jgi:protein transport protein SEC24